MTVAKPSSNRSHHRGGRHLEHLVRWFGPILASCKPSAFHPPRSRAECRKSPANHRIGITMDTSISIAKRFGDTWEYGRD